MKTRGLSPIPSEYRRPIEYVIGPSSHPHSPVSLDSGREAVARLIGRWYAMGLAKLLRQISRVLKPGLSVLWDALPPYRYFEGVLGGKEIGADGMHYIVVDSSRVSVDSVTFDLLEVGETIRLRYTRANRAINIDRFGKSPD